MEKQYKQLELFCDAELINAFGEYQLSCSKSQALYFDVVRQLERVIHLPSIDIALGSWTCENSPIGHCIYNLRADWGKTNCLYCHESDERK